MERVAVIIPVYNDASRLDLCLRALSEQSYPQSSLAVYVVDNNSTEDIMSVVKNYGFAKYLLEECPGSYSARNQALSNLTDEEYVGFTDSDCIPSQDWVANAVNKLRCHPLSAVGGRITVFPASGGAPSTAEQYEMLFGFPQKTYVESDKFAVTANLFTTRQVITLVGDFSTELYSGGDAEYGNRMFQAGVTLRFAEDVLVEHPARTSIKQLTRKIRRTAGGCYQQRNTNPTMANSFSWTSLAKGFLPPVKAWVHLSKASQLTILTRLKLGLLALLLKYSKSTIKLAYRLQLINTFDRF